MAKAACLLAAVFVLLPLLPTATAIACPPDQVFTGTLLPGETDTISVTTTVQGNTSFQFVPKRYDLVAARQVFTMTVGGSSITCACVTAFTFAGMAAGTRTVTLHGDATIVAGQVQIEDFVVTDYELRIHQSNCS